MREKINNNPVVQAVLLGVLGLGVALMLMMRMGGGSDEAASTDPVPPAGTATTVVNGTAPADPAAATAVPTDPAAAAPTDPAAAPASTAPASGPTEFKTGPGLPAPVVSAWDGGQAVALLIVNGKGVDDRDLEAVVRLVGSRSDVAVFVTDVKHVADYSRITQGADVSRTPVLLVIQPKRLTEGPMPTVSVNYGFRGPGSVEQAFDDALYSGPNDLPAYP